VLGLSTFGTAAIFLAQRIEPATVVPILRARETQEGLRRDGFYLYEVVTKVQVSG
jgi:hypothetical protein